jgi:NADH-quinone oxidoreductase subunit N
VTLTSVQSVDWAALSPVLVPAVLLLVILLFDAVAPPQTRAGRGIVGRFHDLHVLLGLVGSGIAVAWLAAPASRGEGVDRATVCVPGSDVAATSCSFVVTPLTLTLQAIVIGGALVCVLLALDGPGAADRTPHHVLLLAAVTGSLALAGARDLATLVIALETATLPAVGLVALRRDAHGAQAGLTFLLTTVASLGVLLLGVALLLLATGSLHLDRIATVLAAPDLPPQARAVAVLGAVLAVAGVGFKLSAVPFHLWTPDTYAGAPLPVAAFLSVVSKAAGLAAVVVLLGVGLPALADTWAPVVAVVAAVTVTVGNLVALRQRVAVRLLAWSTVAQAGWVLLPLGSAAAGSPAALRSAVAASIGYLAAYAVATLAVFAVVILFARHHPAGEEHTLDAYRGLARREPVAAAALAFGLACLAGLPPGIVGLVAKVIAVRPLVDGGTWWLAAVAVVNVALGIVYYLRWAALLVARPEATPPTWRVRPAEGVALGAAAAACLAASVWPQLVAGLLPGPLR